MKPQITGRVAPPAPYFYRRPLRMNEIVPAIGVGIGVGAAAFYVARLLLQRTLLAPAPDEPLPPHDPAARG